MINWITRKRNQNKKLLENLRKYEEKKVKQQESKILEQRATEETKGKRKETFRYHR